MNSASNSRWYISLTRVLMGVSLVFLGNTVNGSNAKNGSNGASNGNGNSATSSTHEDMNGSPNGNGRNSIDSDDDERDARIRVGKDYQAVTPNFIEVESKLKVKFKLRIKFKRVIYRSTARTMSGKSPPRVVTRPNPIPSQT